MGFLDLFMKKKTRSERYSEWKEFGAYNSQFNAFGSDIYKSATVRQAIRPIAEHTSKAFAHSTRDGIADILNISPNIYMNGKDFLAKVRTRLELYNTAFIWIQRGNNGVPVSFYPVPYTSFEALEYNKNLFIRFTFSAAEAIVVPWEDLAVLRKDYNSSDFAGDDNRAVLSLLELMNTTNQGISNAVKATANLRGILKSTKAMLSDDDIKKQKDRFVKDYLNLENEGGIASLDSTQEFTPITMTPTIVSWEQRKQFRDDVYSCFGVSDSIVNSNYTEAQMEAFYDSRIEPFLIALSDELTRKVFTERERAFGAEIVYESNRLKFSSTATKLAMVSLVDRSLLTPNEYRKLFDLDPYEGGDEFVLRLDTGKTGNGKGSGEDD